MCEIKKCGCNIPNNPVICVSYQEDHSCEDRNLAVSNTTDPTGYDRVTMITPEVNQISAYKEHLEFVNSPEPLSGIKKHSIIRFSQKWLNYISNIFKGKNIGTGVKIYKGSSIDNEDIFQEFRTLKSNITDIQLIENEDNIEIKLSNFGKYLDLVGTKIRLLSQDFQTLGEEELLISNINNLQQELEILQFQILNSTRDLKGFLKVEDTAPIEEGKYELIDIGSYDNLIPNIPYGEAIPTNTPIITEDNFYNYVFFDGTNYIHSKIEKQINTSSIMKFENSVFPLTGSNIQRTYNFKLWELKEGETAYSNDIPGISDKWQILGIKKSGDFSPLF